MTQKSVEIVIGVLATDEEIRRRFRNSPGDTLRDLVGEGLPLSPVEMDALARIDLGHLEAFSDALDTRLQKVALRGATPRRSGR